MARTTRIGAALALGAIVAVLAIVRGFPGSATGAAQIQSLAVLPFDNLTGDPGQEYFVDGMTEALTTELAQAEGLQIISRTSAMQYKRTRKPLPVIGHELNVDALLEGAIVRSGQHVRVTAQLIHAATDRHVWAQTYDGEMKDVLALQQQIARSITTAIGSRLRYASPRTTRPLAVNPGAYDAYLQGLAAGGRDTYDGFRIAVGYFENAIAKQPDFAVAHSALAKAQLQFLYGGPRSPREVIPKAEAAARRALRLDDTLAEAHASLGTILQTFYWRWDEAEDEFRRARELRGSSAETQPEAVAALFRSGRLAEAIGLAERTRQQDPLSFNACMNLAIAYRTARQYDRAVAAFHRALEITPTRPRAHFQLGVTFLFMDRVDDAIRELETAAAGSASANPRFEAYLGYAYATAGQSRKVRGILNELESLGDRQYVSAFGMALIQDALGDKDAALLALERAGEDRAVEFTQLTQYPPFRTIASEPRYEAVMRRVRPPR